MSGSGASELLGFTPQELVILGCCWRCGSRTALAFVLIKRLHFAPFAPLASSRHSHTCAYTYIPIAVLVLASSCRTLAWNKYNSLIVDKHKRFQIYLSSPKAEAGAWGIERPTKIADERGTACELSSMRSLIDRLWCFAIDRSGQFFIMLFIVWVRRAGFRVSIIYSVTNCSLSHFLNIYSSYVYNFSLSFLNISAFLFKIFLITAKKLRKVKLYNCPYLLLLLKFKKQDSIDRNEISYFFLSLLHYLRGFLRTV